MKNELASINNLSQIIYDNLNNKLYKYENKFMNKLIKAYNRSNLKIIPFISQIPIIKESLKFDSEYVAIIPKEFLEKLKNGSLKFMKAKKDGKIISNLVDSKTGEVVHQLRLKEIQKLIEPDKFSIAANNCLLQIQLAEIQQQIISFRIEANLKLDEILEVLHEDRIIVADEVKECFKQYLSGNIKKETLIYKIAESKPILWKELEHQINAIKKVKDKENESNYEGISDELNEKIQTRIKYILETVNSLRDVYMIEYYLFKDDKKQCEQIIKEYYNNYLKNLSEDNINLLESYTDFNFLKIDYNIWTEKMLPYTQSLSQKSLITENISNFNK